MKKKNNGNVCRINCENLSNRCWIKNCKLNEDKIFNKAKKDINFEKNIDEIVRSRTMLYSSYFQTYQAKL